MRVIHFLINKLAGYDVRSKQKELEQSIDSLQKEKENLLYTIRKLKVELTTIEREKINSCNLVNELKASIRIHEEKNRSLAEELNASRTYGEEQKRSANHFSNQFNVYKTHYIESEKAKKDLIARHNEEIEVLESSLKNRTDDYISLQHKVDALTQQLTELHAIETQKEHESNSYKETIVTLTRDKSILENIIAKNEKALNEAVDEKVTIQNMLNAKQELIVQKDAEIEQLTATLIQLQAETVHSKSRNEEIRELENQIQVLQEHLSDSKRNIEIKNSIIQQKESEIKEIGNKLTDVHEQIKELQDEINIVRTENANKKDEIQRLKESLSMSDDTPIEREPELITEQIEESLSENINSSDRIDEQTKSAFITNNHNECDKTNDLVLSDTIAIENGTHGNGESNKPEKSGRIKSKEEEVIEMSGNSMMDFPPIINDSKKHVQRSIEYVFDKEGHKIYANDFFEGTAEEIARKSRQLEEAGITGKSDFICGMCHRPVIIAHRTFNGKESLFFAHATRNEYCAWIPYSTSSKDEDVLIEGVDFDQHIEEGIVKPHSRILKEMIFSLLCTQESEKMGISDVKCDAVIRSCVPYMKWRRPDISFKYKEKDVVIVMQKKKHDLHMLVDRDVFFRLNNHHVIWIFGADNDASYDYMKLSNYKNTLFDCHRNVFVFDKEAQQASEKKNTLCLKYNWLDENDNWAFSYANIGSNGSIADMTDFIFDNEYCKPFIKEANEPYFKIHPEARAQYLESRKSREQLLIELEEKWKGEPSYEEAIRMMKLRNEKSSIFQYMGLWGFRFNTTTLIQPVFTEEPIDLNNGFFMVKQGRTVGLVNYFSEVVMDWTIIECEKLSVNIPKKHVLFLSNGLWGVADFKGNILIQPQFVDITPWSDTIYRVRQSSLWGLQSVKDISVVQCIYDSIGELVLGKAEAILRDREKSWVTYKGFIDSLGHVIDSGIKNLNDSYAAYERFSKWGVRTTIGKDIIKPIYDDILHWSEDHVRVRLVDKWGVINLRNGDEILPIKFDLISDLIDGKAQVSYVGVTNLVDVSGNVLSEKSIKLQNGFVKSMIGGKWGIDKEGKEIVPHKYDEIGSFRQRLIGVINSSIVKLSAYYEYNIPISGKCVDIGTKGAKIDIAGVNCYLSNTFINSARLEERFSSGQIFTDLAFGNLIFNQKQYLLRFISEGQMQKRMSHGDKDSDFGMNETIVVTIIGIMRYKNPKGKVKTTKIKAITEDGRETMIPRRFFIAASLNIEDFKKGDVIKIQKNGFDDELDQTIWKIHL